MKKWLIILAITNVVTLIALSITVTVLVMRDYLNTYEEAEKKDSQSNLDQVDELKRNYKIAKDNENISKTDESESSKDEEETKTKPEKKTKKLTLEEYNKIPFELRWCIKIVCLNMTNTAKSYFTIENMFRDSMDAYIGTIVEDHEVIGLEDGKIIFKAPSGIILEIAENYSPDWSKEDLPSNKITDYRAYQDPDTGEIKPGLQNPDSEDEDEFETIVDENGNVIKVRKGTNTNELIEETKNKIKEAEKAETETKKESYVPSEHHSLEVKEAYKIQENFPEYLNQAVLENYWDTDKGKFVGISIVNFADDSMYKQLGFKKDDIVTKINGNDITSTFDLDYVLKSVDFTKGVQVQILRDNKPLKLVFNFSYDKLLEYEKKLLEAFKDSGIDPENDDDNE